MDEKKFKFTQKEFDAYRQSFRKGLLERTKTDVENTIGSLLDLQRMTARQRWLLIDDCKLMLDYLGSKSHSLNEEFEKIMKGFYGK